MIVTKIQVLEFLQARNPKWKNGSEVVANGIKGIKHFQVGNARVVPIQTAIEQVECDV
jgi:hypothetical protein